MDRSPLMPKATAVWLVDNTSLTFEQIAEFCGLHVLEVKGIADGDVAHGIKGMDPISSGQLSREEIARAELDPSHRLKLSEPKVEVPEVKTKRGPRYTPVSRRQDRPNAILWLLKNHSELKDSQIMRLVGTTKPTIIAIRERSHWNSPNLQAQDPVTLGLCSQIDLDAEVKKAAARLERERKEAGLTEPPKAGTLLPAGAHAPTWNGGLFESHYVFSPQFILINRYELVRMSQQAFSTNPGNLGNLDTLTFGFRYNPFMNSRAGMAYFGEYGIIWQKGTSPVTASNMTTNSLVFGIDFDF